MQSFQYARNIPMAETEYDLIIAGGGHHSGAQGHEGAAD